MDLWSSEQITISFGQPLDRYDLIENIFIININKDIFNQIILNFIIIDFELLMKIVQKLRFGRFYDVLLLACYEIIYFDLYYCNTDLYCHWIGFSLHLTTRQTDDYRGRSQKHFDNQLTPISINALYYYLYC